MEDTTFKRLDIFKSFLKKEPNVPLMELEKRERERGFPIIGRGLQDLLMMLMTTIKPEYILELGCGVGFSSILMASYSKHLKSIDTVELKEKNLIRARKNIQRFGYESVINCIHADAAELLSKGMLPRQEYDFIFVDCAKAQYANLWEELRTLIRPGGIILTDDILQNNSIIYSRFLLNRRDRTTHKRMRKYLYAQMNDPDFTSAVFEIDDGVLLAVKNEEE